MRKVYSFDGSVFDEAQEITECLKDMKAVFAIHPFLGMSSVYYPENFTEDDIDTLLTGLAIMLDEHPELEKYIELKDVQPTNAATAETTGEEQPAKGAGTKPAAKKEPLLVLQRKATKS